MDERKECRRKEGRSSGAQTFRRGRAILFYEQLEVKQETLRKQLEDRSLEVIHTVIAGELKATEAIMSDFKKVFALEELMEPEK